MRRSLRDSIVGFSLIGGVVIFTFFSFWLRGIKLSSKDWHIFAEFNNASGLSKKSPVTYRGIIVGSIQDLIFTNESIKAKIVFTNPEIILAKPAFAKVVTNSFLGGDVQVAIETTKVDLPENVDKATSNKCNNKLIVCPGDTISGKQLSSLSNITSRINELLKNSNQENLVKNIVNSIEKFDQTQENLDELIFLSKQEITRVKPLLNDLTIAAGHLNQILATVNDQETLEDIKLTLEATSSISQKIDVMADDFELLMRDQEFTSALRDLAIGLSKFLNEIYP
tara:strand:+ start:675 stop:1520 length:846 start_codon:yes stop_codon:yes gene_type:complete